MAPGVWCGAADATCAADHWQLHRGTTACSAARGSYPCWKTELYLEDLGTAEVLQPLGILSLPVVGRDEGEPVNDPSPSAAAVISWVSCHDPANDVHRRCTWAGATRQIVITGLPAHFSTHVPCSFELPSNTEIHEVPSDINGLDLAARLGGVLFTVLLSPEQAVSWPPR